MKRIILTFLLISTKLTFGQINNGGFEVWDTVYTNTYSSDLNTLFGVPNPIGGVINYWEFDSPWGISRTTDSYSGGYSLILHNWYQYVEQKISYSDTINFRPQYLQGYFKYITGGDNELAQGNATVTLTRFNGSSNDTIANGTYLFDSTAYFTPFQINLNYISSLTPDSIKILIINSDKACTGQYMVCNLLYLDNLTLTDVPLAVENFNSKPAISFYPNPAKENIAFKLFNNDNNYTLNIYDIFGRLNKTIMVKNNSPISLSGLAKGIYFFTLIDNTGQTLLTDKILKQE